MAAHAPKGSLMREPELVSSGQLTLGGRVVSGLPVFCRIAGSLRPTADSDIQFEVWLPVTGWNGKFQGIGNGGFAGTITYAGLVDAVKHGYATASTDTGHSEAVNTSAAWALHHPEKVIDFGYRAVHETAVAAKGLIAAFYGEGPKKSYFSSCSNGGRQALMEAQRFPEDYDGIIAGAPAYDWTRLLSASGVATKAMLVEPGGYIGPEKLPAIQAAALAQCDALDGVKDGVIEHPPSCRFEPSVLVCKDAATDSCLTPAQVKTLQVLYGPKRDASGNAVLSGYVPGGEAENGGWASWITGKAPGVGANGFDFFTNFFRYVVHEDPAWDYKTFDLTGELKLALDQVGRYVDATDPNLEAFRKRGGRLLLYHGWSDAAIPPSGTVKYYDDVRARMGPDVADTFVRLYMVPGMQHCQGGAGPYRFGQGGTPEGDPDRNIDAALEAWVEKAKAPEAIIASGPVRTRPLCVWPQVAKYRGSGSTDDAANFTCGKP
jgi:feruloyl esterase